MAQVFVVHILRIEVVYPVHNIDYLFQGEQTSLFKRSSSLILLINQLLLYFKQKNGDVTYLSMHDINGSHLLFTVKLVGLYLVEAINFVSICLLFNNVDPVLRLDLVRVLRRLSNLTHLLILLRCRDIDIVNYCRRIY